MLIFVVVVTVLIVAVVDIDADVGRTGTRSKSICSFIGAWVLEVVPYVVVIACGAFLADDRPLAVADNVTDTISLTGTDIFPAMQKSATNQLQNVISEIINVLFYCCVLTTQIS